jgi:MFS transporter, SP family, arabinose:H+ symporter
VVAALTPNRCYLLFVCTVAGFGGLLFGYDTAVISGAVDLLRAHFRLDPLALGWVVGSALVGCVLGSAAAGQITDLFGRRISLAVSAFLFLISGLCCYFSLTVTQLVIARVIGGIGVGVASLLVPIYIAELAPPNGRGALVSLNQVAILVGMVCSYFVNAWVVVARSEVWLSENGWRVMLGAESVPALLFLLMTFVIPESPRWLLGRGRTDQARNILVRLHGAELAHTEETEISHSLTQESRSVADLFTAGSRSVVLMAMVLALFQAVTGINIVMYYAPTIFTSAGIVRTTALGESVIIGLVMLGFTLLSMVLVDRLGRRPLMLIASVGMGLSLALLGIMYSGAEQSSVWLLIWILTYVSSFSVGMGGTYWVVVSEVFPTRVRGVAVSLSVIFLWAGNYFVSQFFPVLLSALKGQVFNLFAFMCLLCFAFVWLFVPETKRQTLEQLEGALFQSPRRPRS